MPRIGDEGTLLVVIADKGPDGQAREDGHHHHKGQPADGGDLDREDQEGPTVAEGLGGLEEDD